MGKNTKALACATLAVVLLSGCAMRTPDGYIHSLGIATVETVEVFEGREDGLVGRRTIVETDAFSGWEAVITGTGNAVVKILTLGLL